MARQAAHEFCSCMHLGQAILGTAGAYEIPRMLGFPDLDNRFCTTWGEDVTYIFHISSLCGVQVGKWTIHGWILDDSSMQALKEEFPEECPERPEHFAVSGTIGAMAVQSPLCWRLPTGQLKWYSPR